MLLVAVLCLAAVGAHGGYLFYAGARGPWVGGAAAIGIEALYLGAAGAAVRYLHQQIIAWCLVLIGTCASAFFGVMVSLRHELPALFDPTQPWPSDRAWIVAGMPAIIEGILPSLCSLLLSVLLHSMVF